MRTVHRVRLNPTPEQEKHFNKCAKVARDAWNWGVTEMNRRIDEDGVKPSKVNIVGKGDSLKAAFTRIRVENYPLTNDVSAYVYQEPFRDLQKARSRYFKMLREGKLTPPKGWKGRKDNKPFGWPRRKAWFKTTPAFYEIKIKIDDHFLTLPRLDSWVNMTESLRFNGDPVSARFTHANGFWWAAIQVDVDHIPGEHNDNAVGIDWGVRYLATLSDPIEWGDKEVTVIDNPRILRQALAKLRRSQRKLDRQRRANNPDAYDEKGQIVKGRHKGNMIESVGMRQAQQHINNQNYRVACIRNELAHQLTTKITKRYGIICIEDLNIKGMLKNKRIAKDLADAALGEKRRQVEYKAARCGGIVVAIDRWFPSSKQCNDCGFYNVDIMWGDTFWVCPECGTLHDRDVNAARNIKKEGLRMLSVAVLPGRDVKSPVVNCSIGGIGRESMRQTLKR